MQGDSLKFLDHEHTFLVDKGFPAGDRCLADTQLLLVEAGIGGVEELIRRPRFGQRSFCDHPPGSLGVFGMHTSGIDRGCRIVIVRGGRYDIHPSAVIAIAGVASHHGAIRRGFFADHDTRTTLRVQDRLRILDLLRYRNG